MASTLADALTAGDPAAFTALYDRLAVRLFNTAASRYRYALEKLRASLATTEVQR